MAKYYDIDKKVCWSELSLTNFRTSSKHVLIWGFPSVIFCTAFSKLDEQESTRSIIISPETTQEKIDEGLKLLDERLSDKSAFARMLEQDIKRNALRFRIELIRASKIENFKMKQGLILEKFKETHEFFNPRAFRDYTRIYSLAYGHALLNMFHREKDGNGALIANEEDAQAAYELYNPIADANESGISPELYNFYTDIVCRTWTEKNDKCDVSVGVSYAELGVSYRRRYHQSIDRERLRKNMEALIQIGFVESLPDPDDKRKPLFSPLPTELSRSELAQDQIQHTLRNDILETTVRQDGINESKDNLGLIRFIGSNR